jgi:Beta-lactamase class A
VGLQLRCAGVVIAERDANLSHYAASTMKLAVLGAALEAVAAGELPIDLPTTDRFTSAVGGEFTILSSDDQDEPTWARLGTRLATSELTERMITVSSNLATDLLADHLGLGRVNDFIRRAGLSDAIRVGRLIGDAEAESRGHTNTVTASGLAQLLEGLTDRSLLDAAGTARATALLAGQTHVDMIPAGLPPDTWSASKGGWVDGVNHDVALVRPSQAPAYILAICTSTGLSHDAGCALVAELSRITWEHWIA